MKRAWCSCAFIYHRRLNVRCNTSGGRKRGAAMS
jgi:hypothetical protein